MKILIISDVHGNLPALEYVLKREGSADIIVSLGDVVNYGPWSNECVDLLSGLNNAILLMGNHEEAFIERNYSGSNKIAQAFFNHCIPSFSRFDEIAAYKKEYVYNEYHFVHTLHDDYIYPDSKIELSRNEFIGHSHRLFTRFENGYRLVNVGSVGQCRTNIDELNYVIWRTDENRLELVVCEYDATPVLKEMVSRKYPAICMDYIMSKRKRNK